MQRPDPLAPAINLDGLKRRINNWRTNRRRRRPMPEDLWQEAAKLARVQGISPIASALGLNYYGLKERAEELPQDEPVSALRPAFVEIEPPASLFASSCVVEVESAGDKMTLRLSGHPTVDAISLLNSFWSRER